ncbi:MAG: hypothetical protein KKF78_09335 [Candidatus Omnitrophica bacterium]|nr:hypothetical protein [Candidatus Omnitrophota bacterium]
MNTSLEALTSTIETDNEIANWFYYLLSESSLENEFGKDSQFSDELKDLRHKILFQNTVKVIVLLFLAIVLFLGKIEHFLAFVPMFILLFVNDTSIRKGIGRLSQRVLSRDFVDNDFENKSLYQIGENYCKKYGVASLVTVQFFTVNFVRLVFVSSVVVFAFAFPLKIQQSYIAIAILFYASKVITGFHFMFNRMK